MKVRPPLFSLALHAATRKPTVAACSLALLLSPAVTRGADQAWSGGGVDGLWSNNQNWVGLASPGSTSGTTDLDVATFNAPIANTWGSAAANPVVIDAGRNIQGINFDLAAGNYFLGSTGGNALQLTGGGTIQVLSTLTASNAVHTINAPLAIQGSAYTFANDSANGTGAGAGSLNFGGGISGGIGGASVLTLTGSNTNANTISGAIGNGSATPLAVSKTGSGTWTLAAANTYTGGTAVSGGTLQVASGGSISGGVSLDSTGTLQVTGGSVSCVNLDRLYVGRSGTGTMNITAGSVFSTLAHVGANGGSSGTVTVSGGSWTSNSSLNIGDSGTGVLNVTGGTVSGYNSLIGSSAGSNGTATVSSGSWTSSSALYVGANGSGVLNVTGGSVSTPSGSIGYNFGSSGTATVSSGSWHNADTLFVGYGSVGVLNVSGGSVFGFTSVLGFNSNPYTNGTATISGGNWNTVYLTVGRSGDGTLNITDSGVVSVGGASTLTLAQNSDGQGTLNLGTGGTAGTLTGANTIATGSGTAVVNFNHTGSYTFSPNMTGTLKVNKLGAGSTVLTGTNSHTGVTTVSAGALFVNGSLTGSAITVTNAGSTLGGNGTVGAVTVGTGAILQGGDGTSPSGALTSGGNVSLLDGALIELTLGPSATHSSLIRTGGTWSFDANQAFAFNFDLETTDPATYQDIITGLSGLEAGLSTIASWTISTPGMAGSFSYDGAGNVDLTISTVPEPGAATMLLVGLSLLGLRSRRRG